MKMNLSASAKIMTAAMLTAGLCGCQAFQASTTDLDVNDPVHMGSRYDYSDMRKLTEEVGNELIGSEFLIKQDKPPVIIVVGVQNRTSDHNDTKSLTDRIRTMVIKSGKAQFINESRRDELLREQGYQAANATKETQVAVARQMGAKYMLSGSLVEMESRSPREARLSRKEINYYKLTIEVTDLETSLIAWTTEKEFSRKASLPLIGW